MPAAVWGPLSNEKTRAVGAHAPVCSVVIRPDIPAATMEMVRKYVVLPLQPKEGDTPKELCARLARCTLLDNPRMLCAHRGRHGWYEYLNSTTWKQPRRATFSACLDSDYMDEDGDLVCDLVDYPHHRRHPDDHFCRRMPQCIEALRDCLVEAARADYPGLDSLPNCVEVMSYYTLFHSCCPRHRDMFDGTELRDYYLRNINPFETSSKKYDREKPVLIFTEGNAPMTMPLSFPTTKGRGCQTKESYDTSPQLCIPLLSGTLLIYSNLDDFFYAHEVEFAPGVEGFRVALVFRWLSESSRRRFHACGPNASKVKKTPYVRKRKKPGF